MGRPKKKDIQKVDSGIEKNKELLEEAKTKNGLSIKDVFEMLDVKDEGEDSPSFDLQHIPKHTLDTIKNKLGQKVKKTDEDGNEYLAPLYNEEEKAKMMFGLLAERSINLLDHLENVLGETGYRSDVVFSINETMGKVSELLMNIGEIQYRKAKLENERTHLEIQKYKADLKKREIEIKEKANDTGSGNTNVIAVGNTSELLELLGGQKSIEDVNIVEEDNGEEEE